MKSKKRKLRKNFFADNYAKCWDYLGESKNFIFAVVGIFLAFFAVGFFAPSPGFISGPLTAYLKEIVGQIQGLSAIQLISFIFFNNAKTGFFGIVFGVVLGILPVAVSAFNGYVLGFVSRLSVNANGFLVLWRLLPHGIFELPAVFISLGMGMKLGAVILKKNGKIKENFLSALRVFISIVVPLLMIAAAIEGSLIYFFGN